MTQRDALYASAQAQASAAAVSGAWADAAKWWERAWRIADRHWMPGLHLASALNQLGDKRAIGLLAASAKRAPAFETELALVSALLEAGRTGKAATAMARLLSRTAVGSPGAVAQLARPLAAALGQRGWLGWGNGRLLLGAAADARLVPEDLALRIGRTPLVPAWQQEAPGLWSAPYTLTALGARAALLADAPLLGAPLRLGRLAAADGLVETTADGVCGWVWHPNNPHQKPSLLLEGHAAPLELAQAPNPRHPFAPLWRFSVPLPPGATHPQIRPTTTRRSLPTSATFQATRRHEPARVPPAPSPTETVLLVTHDEGGGIERHVQQRADALAKSGQAALFLRSQRLASGTVRLEGAALDLDQRFRLPDELPALLALLGGRNLASIEFHHLRRHPAAVRDLPSRLGLPYDVVLHDYALLCPRATLVNAAGQFCGEAGRDACDRCAAAYEDSPVAAPDGVAALRNDSARLLAAARGVVAPSLDMALRFRRQFPGRLAEVRPWETPRPRRAQPRPQTTREHVGVCVVGAINQAKGYDVLLACVRESASRKLPLRFTVVGHTEDDAALIEAGAFVTGPYTDSERAALIARQRPALGFLPSIWPEPWCYALTGLLDAGLPTLCFDIGAQAGRVRHAGGRVVSLRATPAELNGQLLELAARHG